MAESTLETLKQNLIDYVRLQIGDGIVDLELDPAHYEAAYQKTVGVYRQRAQNAYEESYTFMELVRDVNIYTLPQEVITVRQIFRRTFGDSAGPFSSNFDPFSQASLNVYLMNFNVSGGLATYDFYSQYVELAARMFGGFMNFTWNQVTKKLQIIRDPKATGEHVLLWTYNLKPEVNLLQDFQIVQWIRDYMVANCKMIIGEAREKFGQIAGPQGGGTLNGTAMKSEAQVAMDAKIEELKMYVDGSQPLSWIIG
ncbi:hypothetical protein UFOVP1146_18 [uncultured Caudovirales phage]|uniref:Neck protein n=1 Tax=uncultured Caudovirales phage TaxID=2100421 RepID=A0A6J5QQD2_9CAUD|nr:hypothetical protein UFOVP812_351 [uncultured Caudovirales phage]CAB4165678.1 hypothetical protein UFOVP818_214 [uncultured Caudovirales phage]CAB4186650.1 hypothetical protein UFOVP1146_18 [uncultured Caudovirales phage]CAB4221028.1 hypothetical protein UFOVP1638_127 [uncultured Caudovirales phage]